MCSECFLQEPRSVAHGPDWDNLEQLLATKVAAGQLQKGKYVVDHWRGKEDEAQLYLCASCQQRWWVRAPWLEIPLFSNKREDWRYLPGGCVIERPSCWQRLFCTRRRG